MFKKLGLFAVAGFMMLNLCGCFALFAGAVAGGGTAVWLSGKLTQEFQASYDNTITASKSAFHSIGTDLTKEVREENLDQLRGRYSDGRDVWVDVHRVTDTSTKVEVRVGATGDKEAASIILKKIKDNL